MHTRLLTLLLCSSCSLIVNDPPELITATPVADAGTGEVGIGDAGTDAGPANSCDSDERFDDLGGRCVPLRGAAGACPDEVEIGTNHSWAVASNHLVYASPGATGTGNSVDDPGSLATLVAAGTPELVVVLLPGEYELDETLNLSNSSSITLIGNGSCAAADNEPGGSFLVNSGSAVLSATEGKVQIYGIGVRGPLSDDSGVKRHAMVFDGVGTLRIAQTVINAPSGHGIALGGVGGDEGLLLQGLTFNEVGGSAIASQDALGSWTVDCNLFHGPIADHGFLNAGGESTLSLSNNLFETITKNAVDSTDAVGSWTVDCNLFSGPISGDGINIAGGHSDSSITIGQDNIFAIITGNALSAQGAVGSWTVDCNLFRGPISGKAMHFHDQSGSVALTGNQISGSAKGVFVTGGNAAWTVSGNQINGSQSGVPPGPMIGFGFADLSASASVNFTDNIIANAGLVGLGFLNCLADVLVDDNDIYGTWSDNGGNHPRQYVGVGVLIIDSSGIEVSNNVLRDNAYAAILIDLNEREEASVIVRNNNATNNGEEEESTDVVQQNIAETATVVVTDSGNQRQNRAEERVTVSREVEPPPRCGNGVLEPGETCDGEPNCTVECSFQLGFSSVASGSRHFCAVDLGGRLHCMGRNDHGETALDPLANPYRRILEEISSTHLLLEGPFEAVSAGLNHSCAMSPSNVVCWGDNSAGQLGSVDLNTNGPVEVDGLDASPENPLVQIVSSQTHNCVRRELGQVSCWGRERSFLGLDSSRAVLVESLIAGAIWTGPHNLCAKVDANLVCWGSDEDYKLGTGSVNHRSLAETGDPVDNTINQPLENVVDVAIGYRHVCATTSAGALYCWGNGRDSRLGGGGDNSAGHAALIQTGGANPFTSVATSQARSDGFKPLTCASRQTGEAFCFGTSDQSLLRGGAVTASTPSEARPDIELLAGSMALGEGKACALNPSDKSLVCWGNDNFSGPTTNGFSEITAVSIGFDTPADLKMGDSYALVLGESGKIYQWGQTVDRPDIGQGAHEVSRVGVEPARFIGAAKNAICYSDDNAVYCKGRFDGLGNADLHIFDVIDGAPQGAEIACGDQHCCSMTGPDVVCWGSNTSGQTGHIDRNSSLLAGPVFLGDVGEVVELAVGSNHSCALLRLRPGPGSAVYCWGDNGNRQLGNEPAETSSSPIPVFVGQEGLAHLAAGGDSGCVTDRDREPTSLMCWGNNDSGQLGLHPVANRIVAPGDFLPPPFAPHREAAPSINDSTTCFIDDARNVRCMGSNSSGIIGRDAPLEGVIEDADTVPLANGVTKIGLGGTSACMISDHQGTPTVYCWGDATLGRLGTVSQNNESFLPR